MEHKLVCQNIEKKYGKNLVLNNVNLELEPGKIYGLIGRNGAGKTTLLSIMSAQNKSSEGLVKLGDVDIWENQYALDCICFAREISSSIWGKGVQNMKVKEYLKTASIFYPKWDKTMAERLVQMFEINIKQKIGKLSKGMISMVSIIIALASKAEYTFLDEPVAGLDVIMREFFYKVLLEEFMETGRTFVVSTHIIEEAADVFEEVIMIKDGKILLKENTQELIERSVHVSGKSEDVDLACEGLHKYKEEKIGRGKGVTVLLNEGEQIKQNPGVSVQTVNLQNVFVALCGMEG
jgi:ABC-2 type transport system ATP-binding protein